MDVPRDCASTSVRSFYMAMREKYTQPGGKIHYYLVEWDAKKLSWEGFRNSVRASRRKLASAADCRPGQRTRGRRRGASAAGSAEGCRRAGLSPRAGGRAHMSAQWLLPVFCL